MRNEHERAWLLPFLRGIRARPGMYLGHENARLLWQYLEGYVSARVDIGLSAYGDDEIDHLRGFTEWLRQRYGYGRSTVAWHDVIEQLDPSPRNLATFFTEFGSYLQAIGIDLDSVEPRIPQVMRLGPPA